jgi:hypothetical protein
MTDISVTGNVEGNIVVGNNNFVVNNNYGTVVNQQAAPPVQRKSISPQPPRKPRSFVGRKRELDQVNGLIASNTPVILHGIDGIGKTSLLKQAANSDAAKSQPDGVVFLEGLDESGKLLDFGDLTQRLFNTLYDTASAEVKVDHDSARTYLSNTRPLVLLNSISLSAADLDKLADLFPNAPILIATEETAQGEAFESVSLGPLTREDALTLLANSTSIDNQEQLSQLAALLENIPAALSIVANTIRQKGLSVDEAFTRLQAYTPVEKDKSRAAEERAFALMFATLADEEKGMLLQTAAAPGISIDRKWLENVSGGSAVSEKLESMEVLQANSPRLRLMPGLRSFLLRDHDISKERERLLTYLVAEVKTRWRDFDFIQNELGNLLGLLFWAAAQGQWLHVAQLGRALDPYLTLRGMWDAWRKTLGEIQKAAGPLHDLALEGWALHQLGTYEIGMGNTAAAQNFLKQAISIRKKLGDETGVAYSQHNLQLIAPVAQAPARTNSLRPWLFGGMVVAAAIGAFLFFGGPRNNQIQPVPTTTPVIVPTEVIVTPSVTITAINTPTFTPSPLPTNTLTATPSPTDTITPTPTYTTLTGLTINHYPTACRYGPGDVYMFAAGIAFKVGDKMDVFGRAEVNGGDSTWLLVDFSPPTTPLKFGHCWINAKYLDITPDQIRSVAPKDPEIVLPVAVYWPDPERSYPKLQSVVRQDATHIVVYWSFYDVVVADREDASSARYLIDAWVCRAGKIVFMPIGVYFPQSGPYNPVASYIIPDEPGCKEPSHARLYLAWKDAYAGPVEIKPWP